MENSFIDKLIPDDYSSKSLWHYTTQDGLLGILENKKIWCSNVFYLNDQDEYINGWRSFFKTLDEFRRDDLFANSFYTAINQYYGHFADIVKDNSFETDFGKIKFHEYHSFVFSLSTKSNDLNQWRAYSNGTNGYSIKFHFNENFFTKQETHIDGIRNNVEDSNCAILLKKCIYKSEEKTILINKLIKHYYNEFEKQNSNWENELFFDILTLSYFFKNEHFYGEDEYRLLVILNRDTYKENKIKFRKGKYTLIPYIELDTIIYNIQGITIGPTPLIHQSFSAIKILLSNLLNSNPGMTYFEPIVSDVPFRVL